MMKKINAVLYVLLFMLIGSSVLLSQDMSAEAGQLYNEGNKLLKAGNYDGALEKYNSALNMDKDYRVYYQRGIALKNLGNHEEAKKSFQESIKLKSDFEGGYNALGGVYFSMGNYQQSIDNFEKVLEFSKNNSVKNTVKKNLSLAYTKLGSQAENNGNSSAAIENYKKGAETNNYDAAYLSLSKLYSELGNWDAAINAAENALKYRSSIGKGGPYYYMGVGYKGKGDMTKAKEMFNLAKSDATYRKTAEYELSLLQ